MALINDRFFTSFPLGNWLLLFPVNYLFGGIIRRAIRSFKNYTLNEFQALRSLDLNIYFSLHNLHKYPKQACCYRYVCHNAR